MKHLNSIQQLLENKGKLKSKKFHNLVESIDSSKGLGPLNPQSRTAAGAKQYQEVDVDQLVEGTNEGKVTLGKVICSVHSEESVPL